MNIDEYENRIKQAYAEGFAAARDMAKGIAENFTGTKVGMDMRDEIAARIGAMQPGEGK